MACALAKPEQLDTMLHESIKDRRVQCAKLLLLKGANPYYVDITLDAFSLAQVCSERIFLMLQGRPRDTRIYIRTSTHTHVIAWCDVPCRSLHLAVFRGDVARILDLLEDGCDPFARSAAYKNMNCFELARSCNNPDVIKLLMCKSN